MKQRAEFYRLEGHQAIACTDWEWSCLFPDLESRRVARTELAGCHVSTVFLGLDHGMPDGPLEIFETMVFGGGDEWDQYCERYATWEEAEAGHQRIVGELSP